MLKRTILFSLLGLSAFAAAQDTFVGFSLSPSTKGAVAVAGLKVGDVNDLFGSPNLDFGIYAIKGLSTNNDMGIGLMYSVRNFAKDWYLLVGPNLNLTIRGDNTIKFDGGFIISVGYKF